MEKYVPKDVHVQTHVFMSIDLFNKQLYRLSVAPPQSEMARAIRVGVCTHGMSILSLVSLVCCVSFFLDPLASVLPKFPFSDVPQGQRHCNGGPTHDPRHHGDVPASRRKLCHPTCAPPFHASQRLFSVSGMKLRHVTSVIQNV